MGSCIHYLKCLIYEADVLFGIVKLDANQAHVLKAGCLIVLEKVLPYQNSAITCLVPTECSYLCDGRHSSSQEALNSVKSIVLKDDLPLIFRGSYLCCILLYHYCRTCGLDVLE